VVVREDGGSDPSSYPIGGGRSGQQYLAAMMKICLSAAITSVNKLAIGEKLYQVLLRRWENRNKESQHMFCTMSGEPLKYSAKRDLMRTLCERAKVKTFGFHAVWHHVASIFADTGKATLGQIQRLLRHRRQATTENYLHELSRDQREVADLLDQMEGEKVNKGRKDSFGDSKVKVWDFRVTTSGTTFGTT
jgi:integrase